jgi:hypothetical protein
MIIGKNKEDDLNQLEKFVLADKVSGQIANMFFHHLCSSYPLEFIHLVRKHHKEIKWRYLLLEAEEKVNRI